MKRTAVIMAGGAGSRFWPQSRSSYPKQFLSLTDDGKTMIQLTVERLLPLVDIEDVFIVTNANYVSLIREQLPALPVKNILAEPMAKNTAPCIGLAAAVISKRYNDAIMFVLPSDHLIKYNELFLDTLSSGAAIAEEDESLVTIGILPEYPETGYGYIEFGKQKHPSCPNAYKVVKFVEKPNLETAKNYLATGKYVWNSGMFIWKTSTILNNFKQHLPNIYAGLQNIYSAVDQDNFESVLRTEFEGFSSESVDYGILEKASNIFTMLGTFGWDDVGSWLALERINNADENNNVVKGNTVTVDSHNTIILGKDKLIAAVGLDNIIIVDTDDAILICSKESTQDVKKIIDKLKNENKNQYL